MTVFGLALRSLRKRASAFTASFLAMLLGATMIMAFASMLDTAEASGATGTAREAADRAAFVDGGVIVEQGPPAQVIDAPQEERTKQFLGLVLEH